MDKLPEMNYNMNNNYFMNKDPMIRNKNYQSISNNQYQINDKNQNDLMIAQQKYTDSNNEG